MAEQPKQSDATRKAEKTAAEPNARSFVADDFRNIPKNVEAIKIAAAEIGENSKLCTKGYKSNDIQTIMELRKLFFSHLKNEVVKQAETFVLEKKFQPNHQSIFDRRQKYIQQFREEHSHDNKDFRLCSFWLHVLKVAFGDFITEKDEKILNHLNDVRYRLPTDDNLYFVLEFSFDPNPYFTNKTLTKTYYLNFMPDVENPLNYEGAEIYKCEGCKIDWLKPEEHGKGIDVSFFDFFNPPLMPDEAYRKEHSKLVDFLQCDFEMGRYLKDRVIPKAILFFTGDVEECAISDDEETDDDEEPNEADTGNVSDEADH